MDASTFFTTPNAERYLGSLCKHFGHKVPVTHQPSFGRIELPFGQCVLCADGNGLLLTVEAPDRPQLDQTAEVISSHLDRFAFRENPDLTWTVANGTKA
ncbi:DUF2218 domain-containing protein [Sulfitobacter guttiformis]|uniref:DUF2218 domain-containing protein n=1 Tax=Sulfitobacter guttiformis TaxID=74349 RepID=A0A420DSD6_9RHOB|nr:DUF2218 domain-containing protein [Sulfitobacter guttiformis]KIN74480.1 2,4-dihydroxyhept-2-ene-1,7-dioic acid aldolase [Sulfitobacter guttiformis KCTC 32187]RKE97073.1 hypothetical protein C8N30_1658 [Sulfitobacter guttiformis]